MKGIVDAQKQSSLLALCWDGPKIVGVGIASEGRPKHSDPVWNMSVLAVNEAYRGIGLATNLYLSLRAFMAPSDFLLFTLPRCMHGAGWTFWSKHAKAAGQILAKPAGTDYADTLFIGFYPLLPKLPAKVT